MSYNVIAQVTEPPQLVWQHFLGTFEEWSCGVGDYCTSGHSEKPHTPTTGLYACIHQGILLLHNREQCLSTRMT